MSILKAYQSHENALKITPMPMQRYWAEDTFARHAYHCFPVTTANTIGWYLSSKYRIVFEWDGIYPDPTGEHLTIIEGQDYCHSKRGHLTLSIGTGLKFTSDKNISLWTINPVNYFNKDWEVMSSLISTSFYNQELPLALRVISPNKKIVIEPGEPIATIVPISLSLLKNESIDIYDWHMTAEYTQYNKEYGEAAAQKNMRGIWTDWYRDAVNYKGEKIGEHEAKALKLKVNNYSERFKDE
jgi:hypothetical protein